MRILFPMTATVLTPGHIKCLRFLSKLGHVFVGLLTAQGLKGYKKEIVPWRDRKYILDTVALAIGNISVIPQDSLNPYRTLKKYSCTTLASGDGFEKSELDAAKKLKVEILNIRFKNEKRKRYSSSKVLRSSL